MLLDDEPMMTSKADVALPFETLCLTRILVSLPATSCKKLRSSPIRTLNSSNLTHAILLCASKRLGSSGQSAWVCVIEPLPKIVLKVLSGFGLARTTFMIDLHDLPSQGILVNGLIRDRTGADNSAVDKELEVNYGRVDFLD